MATNTILFHKYTGKNVKLRNNGQIAKRKSRAVNEGAVVYSAEPLEVDVLYEVKLLNIDGISSYLHVGATVDDPGREDIRFTFWHWEVDPNWRLDEDSNSWVRPEHIGWCGSVIRACGKYIQVAKGDTVGVMKSSNNAIHFYHNAKDLGKSYSVDKISKVWAVVELETTAKEIARPPYNTTLSDSDSDNIEESDQVEIDAQNLQLEDFPDVDHEHQQLLGEENLEEQEMLYRQFAIPTEQQEFLVAEEEPAARAPPPRKDVPLGTGMKFHRRAGKNVLLANNDKTATCRYVNRNEAIVFSGGPLKPNVLFEAKATISSAEAYVNMGVIPVDPTDLEDANIPDRLFKLKSESCIINMNNLFYDGAYVRPYNNDMVRNVVNGDTVGVLMTSSGDIHFYQNGDDMGRAFSDRTGPHWAVMELDMAPGLELEVVQKEAVTIPRSDSTASRLDSSSNEDYSQQGAAFYPHGEVESIHTPIEAQSMNFGTALPSQPGAASGDSCPYQDLCAKFKEIISLAPAFYEHTADSCFCTRCHSKRGHDLYLKRGVPPKLYGIPMGWCKYGLKTPPRADGLKAFSKWHVAFHGTRSSLIKSIMETGDLLMPGDVTQEGERIEPPKNHWNEASAPSGHDIRRLFLSPSIKYAGCNVYAPLQSFQDAGRQFKARVALQVRIRPDSYEVGKETIGLGNKQMDDKFPNAELEWATNRRGTVIITGLLIKVEEQTGHST